MAVDPSSYRPVHPLLRRPSSLVRPRSGRAWPTLATVSKPDRVATQAGDEAIIRPEPTEQISLQQHLFLLSRSPTDLHPINEPPLAATRPSAPSGQQTSIGSTDPGSSRGTDFKSPEQQASSISVEPIFFPGQPSVQPQIESRPNQHVRPVMAASRNRTVISGRLADSN
ncbi:hypothetical protein ACLOJK_037415 [Asimina triloba]